MSKNEKLSSIYVSMRRKLMKAVSHIVPPKDIEDIVQETYVRACQAENTKHINCPQSYMYTTAKNLAFDHLKLAENRLKSNLKDEIDFDALEFSSRVDDPFVQSVSNSEFAAFCEAVRQLPVKCRRTFVLKKVYGYTQKEIVKALDIPESTVEKHIATGIKRCLHYMSKHDADGFLQKPETQKDSDNAVANNLQNKVESLLERKEMNK